jgi:hypothetical protein
MLCASCSCFVLCAQNHIFWSQIACFMLMLCALCLAVRDKKTRISLRAGASRKSYHAHASCFVLSAWRAVTKNPGKHEAESTKHGAQSMSIKHKARSMSTKQRQKNWALVKNRVYVHLREQRNEENSTTFDRRVSPLVGAATQGPDSPILLSS